MTVLQEPVQAAVWQALNHYAYLDAVFLAERLYAEGNMSRWQAKIPPTCSPVYLPPGSEVRRGSLPAGYLLPPLRKALQGVPAAKSSQLLHATGSIPAGKVLCGAEQVRTESHCTTWCLCWPINTFQFHFNFQSLYCWSALFLCI
uniref:Uncharacterized protein n=1 Tax=Oryzias latipes TaxID=8090 RepID=A0A3B3HAD2_ORYLA